MRTSMPANGRPQLPCLRGREIEVEARAAVRAARLGHAEEVRARSGSRTLRRRQHRREARRAQRREIGRGERRGARRSAPPGPASRGTASRARARGIGSCGPGSGVGLRQQRRSRDEHREQPAAEAARPEERHRDVQPLSGADAARLEPGRGRPQRAAVGVDHALRRAAAARGEQDRPCRRRDERRPPALRRCAGGAGASGSSPQIQTRRSAGSSGSRCAAPTRSTSAGASERRSSRYERPR